jgi:hypothetical protein
MPKLPIGGAVTRRRYGPLIERCRDTLLGYCDAHLAELFQNAGTALLEFAERAESNAVQSRFFEAMGQINRCRSAIEHSFREELSRAFEGLSDGRARPEPAEKERLGGMELALLEPDEMEESVAAENLILRANADCFPELYALSLRLGAITGGKKLKDTEIPGGPSHLVRSYRRSLEGLDVEVRVKVILFALFDKYVLKPIKPTYDAYNALLADSGVLPSLKPIKVSPGKDRPGDSKRAGSQGSEQAPKQPPTAGAATEDGQTRARPPGDTQENQTLGAELFGAILDLMATRQPVQGRTQRRQPTDPPLSPTEAAQQSRELLSAISSVQSQSTPEAVSTAVAEAVQFPNVEVDAAFVERVKDALGRERAQILSAVDQDKLSPMDADLIDLIGMLFEYMLNDPVLPNIAKALLSHLHTPYLKVALVDRRLLVDSRHPARQLLDQMVEAGSQWVEEGNPNRGLFPVMQEIVDRVLQEFTDNVDLFDELLSHFEEKMREQQRRSDTTEQRTQEAARGREKLTLAKQRAAREVQTAMERNPHPEAVGAFLSQTWLDHLTFILLRDPEQDRGSAWRRASAVMEQLVALFDTGATPQAKNARLATLPKLRDEIATAAQRLGRFSGANVAALLALLDSPQDWKAGLGQPFHAVERDGVDPAAGTTVLRITTAETLDEDLTEAERQMVQRLRRMRFGTWFEFTGAPGTPPRRIKLSWMSPLTSTCMFVDRVGMQAEIKSLRDLAREILAGQARVIPKPKHPFIDRALVSIRKMLQGGDKPEAPASSPT